MENKSYAKTIRYFSLLMVFVYIAIGIVLVFTDLGADIIDENRIVIGAVIGGYGIVRLFLTLQRIRKERQ